MNVLTHLLGSHRLTMERLFERLYRIARELETRPQRAGLLLTRLLRLSPRSPTSPLVVILLEWG